MSINIKPINVKEYTCKQSKYLQVPKIPLRGLLLAPSGSGKTVLLTNMILNIYRGCFVRIYIFSPSIHVDQTWAEVKKYQKQEMLVDETKEQLYFDHYNSDDLQNIIDTQHKVILKMKERKQTKLFSILVVVDDFADDPTFTRHSKLLHSLFTRGRHNQISTLVSTQKFAAIAPIIRVNSTFMIVYRLRNNRDLESFIEEVSGLTGKKELLEIYQLATKEPYSFIRVNLTAPTIKDMLYRNLNQN
jgi:hypothetical protein